MAIEIAVLNPQGTAPVVDVLVGFANLASYTIALVPPDMDISKALTIVQARTPEEVEFDHPLPDGWQGRNGWFVVVVGGIGDPNGAGQFAVTARVIQDGQDTPMTTTIHADDGGSAATFLCSVQLQVQA